MKNQAHPIIVVKRRKAKSHGAAHGSWKIAYADFMTAMMAFFLVMWLISISSPKELGAQNVAHIGFDIGTAGSKHRAILAIDDLNT